MAVGTKKLLESSACAVLWGWLRDPWGITGVVGEAQLHSLYLGNAGNVPAAPRVRNPQKEPLNR